MVLMFILLHVYYLELKFQDYIAKHY